MNKTIIAFLFGVFMPLVAMGQGGLVNSVEDLSEQTKMQYAQLLEQVRVVEPYFASMIDAMNISEIAKIAKIRSYFAQKTFGSYKEYMKELFCEKHKESGRQIKTTNSDNKEIIISSCNEVVDGNSYFLDKNGFDDFDICSLDLGGNLKMICSDIESDNMTIITVSLGQNGEDGNFVFSGFINNYPYSEMKEYYQELERYNYGLTEDAPYAPSGTVNGMIVRGITNANE